MTEPTDRPDRRKPDAELRALLERAVDDVEPTPGLERIRARTSTQKVTHMSDKRPWLYGFLGAALATAATVVAVTVLSDDTTAETAGPAATPTAEPTPGDGAESDPAPSPSPTESGSDEPTTSQAVPVYYVGAAPAGPALYREFHRVDVAGKDLLFPAIEEALGSDALDPDYTSPWAGLGASAQSTFTGGEITIGLTSATPLDRRPKGMSADQAELAVQQLVYTATAAVQQKLTTTFEIDGVEADRLLGVDVAGGIGRSDEEATLAPVWVTTPQEGDEVASTFTVEGQGAFFEANVSWQLLDTAGDVVQDGFATAEECCRLAPYSFQVEDVPAGDYVLRVYGADASGGEGGPEPEDSKSITVTG